MNDFFGGNSSRRFSEKMIPPKEAVNILEKSGLTRVEGIGWVPTPLYEKSIASGLLVNRNGYHSFEVEEIETEKIMGYRGRVPIIEKKKQKNVQAITNFFNEKEEYENLLKNFTIPDAILEEEEVF